MKLRYAQWALRRLRRYLAEKGHVLPRDTKVVHSRRADLSNRRKARAFAFVEQGNNTIYWTRAIEELRFEDLLGIILHECGHILCRDVPGDAEVNTDEFLASECADSGYRYHDTAYGDPITGARRLARNVETVSEKMLCRMIGGRTP